MKVFSKGQKSLITNVFFYVYRTAHTRLATITRGAWTTTPWPRPNTRSNTGRGRSEEGSTIAGTDIRKLAGNTIHKQYLKQWRSQKFVLGGAVGHF